MYLDSILKGGILVLETKKFRKAFKIALLCVLILQITWIYSACKMTPDVWLDNKQSFFSDFYVTNGMVCIKCEIYVQNTFDVAKTVMFSATSEDDKNGGLLKEALLIGYQEDLKSDIFQVEPGENCLSLYFVGEFGGKNVKQNRLLPQIAMQIVS